MTQDERDRLLIEVRQDVRYIKKETTDQEQRIRSLEKKFWTSVGAFVISIGAAVKAYLGIG